MEDRKIGKCIYCGSTEPPLSREHIVAYGLGGDLLLLEASCATCAELTSKVERNVLKRMLGNFRVAANFRTRRPKDRPSTLPLPIRHSDGRSESVILSAEEFPVALTLPLLPPARILRGLPPADAVSGGLWTALDENALDGVRQKTGAAAMTFGPLNPAIFNQMLAKIAHCYAVHQLGPDSFHPLAIDLALGRKTDINYLVGGMIGNPPPTSDLHQQILWQHASGAVLVGIRLFAALGAPMYHVVVGSTAEDAKLSPLFESWEEGQIIDLPIS